MPGHEAAFERKELLKEAERHLKTLIEADPRNAEAYALLGAVYGGQITSNWKKITMGSKAERALDLAPGHSRVLDLLLPSLETGLER